MSDDQPMICHNCVGDAYLKGVIARDGATVECAFCGDEGEPGIAVEDLADHIEAAFDRHYRHTSGQPDMYESMLLRDKEMDYDWERHGDPVLDAIGEAAMVKPEVAQAVLDILEDRFSDLEMAQMGEECEFAADSYYEPKDVEDHDFAHEFNAIEQSLKSETRFFNQSATAFLARLFDNLGALVTNDDRPVVVTAGPDTALDGFYRARVFQSSDELDRALARPDLHLGPPPSRIARAGRMNAHGISVFYGASDPGVALAEVRPPVGSRAIVARFALQRSVRLLDVDALRAVFVEGSIFDPDYLVSLALAKFLGRLSARITMPVMPDDEPTEYLITQMIADYLAQQPEPGLDGILFPSVQTPGDARNVVLFHHTARVAALDFPDGTEISAHQYQSTDEGPEPDYVVWEETLPVPVKREARQSDDKDSFGLALVLDPPDLTGPLSYDHREVALHLDLGSVAVHHVRGVTFDTEAFAVRRHRMEKREMPF